MLYRVPFFVLVYRLYDLSGSVAREATSYDPDRCSCRRQLRQLQAWGARRQGRGEKYALPAYCGDFSRVVMLTNLKLELWRSGKRRKHILSSARFSYMIVRFQIHRSQNAVHLSRVLPLPPTDFRRRASDFPSPPFDRNFTHCAKSPSPVSTFLPSTVQPTPILCRNRGINSS